MPPIREAAISDNPITDPLAWRPVKAPSLLDLEILAGTVFAGLPEKFRALCEGLVIRVEDFADDDVLADDHALFRRFGASCIDIFAMKSSQRFRAISCSCFSSALFRRMSSGYQVPLRSW